MSDIKKSPIQPDEIPFKPLVRWVVFLSIALVVSCIICVPMMTGLGSLYGLFINKPHSPMMILDVVPPEPRLQVHDAQDMAEYRRKQDLWLSSYGWTDRPNHIVHIPIQKAMELIDQEGLPQ